MLSEILGFVHLLESRVCRLALLILLVMLAGCGGGAEKRPYHGVTLEERTLYVSARRWEAHGLEHLTQQAGQVGLQPAAPMLEAMQDDGEVTLFIHGYHAGEATVATYFAGLISQLNSTGADRAQFMVLDWPSVARHWVDLSVEERNAFAELGSRNPMLSWEVAQYTADAEKVKRIGADALLFMLDSLNAASPKRRINIVAHSMGCYLVVMAMKKRPQSFAGVGKVIWLAPDMKDNILEDASLAPGLARIGRLDIFFSREDEVLKYLSGILHVSLMLGSHGPAKPGALPNNVMAHDLTQALGKDGVHNRYLEKDSVAASAIAQALSLSVAGKE